MKQTMLFVIFLMTCASGTETLYTSLFPEILPSDALRRLYHAEEVRLWAGLAEGQPWPQLPGNHNAPDPVLLDPVQTFFDQVDEFQQIPLPIFQRMPTFDSESENQSSAGNAQVATSVPAPRTKPGRQTKAHVQGKNARRRNFKANRRPRPL